MTICETLRHQLDLNDITSGDASHLVVFKQARCPCRVHERLQDSFHILRSFRLSSCRRRLHETQTHQGVLYVHPDLHLPRPRCSVPSDSLADKYVPHTLLPLKMATSTEPFSVVFGKSATLFGNSATLPLCSEIASPCRA